MIQTTPECRECGSSNIVKNGHSASGSQQYHCKDCGAHKVLDPEPRGYSEEEKKKILRAYRGLPRTRVEAGNQSDFWRESEYRESEYAEPMARKNRWLEKRDIEPTQ